jgi:hypothetical protein
VVICRRADYAAVLGWSRNALFSMDADTLGFMASGLVPNANYTLVVQYMTTEAP